MLLFKKLLKICIIFIKHCCFIMISNDEKKNIVKNINIFPYNECYNLLLFK